MIFLVKKHIIHIAKMNFYTKNYMLITFIYQYLHMIFFY